MRVPNLNTLSEEESSRVLQYLPSPSPLEEAYISLAHQFGIADVDALLRAIREQEIPGGTFSSRLEQSLNTSSPLRSSATPESTAL